MYHELLIKTPSKEFSAFLQEGFYSGIACSPVHNHNHTEVHLILGGTAVFIIEGKKHEIESGHALIIPKRRMHTCVKQDENTMHSAFQIDCDLSADGSPFEEYRIDDQILHRLFDEIKQCRETDDHTMISAWIALIFCCFHKDGRVEAKKVKNYGFIIHEAFLRHYNEDIRLSDLADMLHLSQRQTERLVRKHTGGSFRTTLAATRVMIAKQLIASSDMSLQEIAEYVGYRSYAGFWKAMKGFNKSE